MTNKKIFTNSIFLWIILSIFGTILSKSGESKEPEKVTYSAKGKRDPFVPLIREKAVVRTDFEGLVGVESIDQINLEGLVHDPAHGSIVVINGVVLTEGQKEAEVLVVKIKEDGAFFEILGKVDFKPFSPETQAEVSE